MPKAKDRIIAELRQRVAELEGARRKEPRAIDRSAEESVPDLIGDIVWKTDLQGNIQYLSPSFETLAGFSVEEGLLLKLTDLVTPESQEKILQTMQERQASDSDRRGTVYPPVRLTLEHLRKDGSVFPVEVVVKFVRDENQNPIGLSGVTRDISERLQAEQSLRESEEKYRLLAENLTDIVWSMDMNLCFTFVSPSVMQIRGYTVEEAMDQSLSETVVPESLEEVMALLARKMQLVESGDHAAWDPIVFQVEQPCKDGTTIFTSNNAKLVRGPDGRPSLIVGVTHDITERLQAESELQMERDKLTAIFESMADGVYIVNKDYDIQYVNAVLKKQFGSHEGKKCHEYFHDSEKPCVFCKNEDVFAGKTVTWEWTSPKNGKTYDLIDTPMRNSDGSISKLEIFKDITDRKQAEEEKAKLEEQFRQSQKMEGIGRLAGGIAHDFNNLMTVVTGYGELLRAKMGKDNPFVGDVYEIIKAGRRATDLTRQLLAFSRKQVLKPEILDLNKGLSSLKKMLTRLLGEDIDLVFVPCSDLGRVHADRGQVEQALMNLALNARDAMPKGGKLTVETANVEIDEEYAAAHVAVKPGSYVMIAMSDSGCGMDEDIRVNIFDPFFTTKEPGKGTGLGLSTVYGIVKQSGGNIWVYSEPGVGTTFKIYLPRIEEAESVESETGEHSTTSDGEETILLVEDDASVRAVVIAMIAGSGYTILEAPHGDKALRICKEHKGNINLLLSDVVMPGMSGPELADQIEGRYPGMKVLFMSGYTDNAIQHHGVLEPGTAFIEKPFSPAMLTRKIREVLDGVEGE